MTLDRSESASPLADRRPAHRWRPHGALQLARRPPRRAASSCCGSRTPTASARPRRTSSRSSTRCAGSSSTGTRGRSRRPRAASATEAACASCSSPVRPTAIRPPPRMSRPGRPAQRRPRLSRRAGRGEGAAVRLRVPDEGETVVEDLIRGPVTFPNRSYDDFVIARGDGTRPLQLRGRGRRCRDGHHRRGPRRRSPLEHPEAAARARGARHRAAALRAPAAAARARRQEALQAPRRRLGAGAARRRLPAGGDPQLPRPARLGRRRRHDDDLDGGAGRALPGRGRRSLRGDLRREEAALGQRPLHARAAARRVHGGRRAPPRARARRSACARPARSPRRKRRRWPRSGR